MPDPGPVPGEVLERGDALAGRLLAWLEPLRFAPAGGGPEREAAYRLRHQAVAEVGMADPAGFPDGMERDAYDEDAVQVLAWDGPKPVATCRLVFPAAGRPMPAEEVFGPIPEAEGAVEWGRVTVDSALRGEGGRIFMGLAARGWFAMRARGRSTAMGVTPRRLVTLFRALGFPVTVLGEPKVHWGVERVPILCRGPEAVDVLGHIWNFKGRPPEL